MTLPQVSGSLFIADGHAGDALGAQASLWLTTSTLCPSGSSTNAP